MESEGRDRSVLVIAPSYNKLPGLADWFQSTGVGVETCANARQALGYCGKRSYTAAVLALPASDSNLIQLAQKLKDCQPEIRLIYVGAPPADTALPEELFSMVVSPEEQDKLFAHLGRILLQSAATSSTGNPFLPRRLSELEQEFREVIYVISHDLRSPLVNIDGFSKELGKLFEQLQGGIHRICSVPQIDALLSAELCEDIEQDFDFIDRSVAKMYGLLNGLLKLSRLMRGEVMIQAVSVEKILDEFKHDRTVSLQEKGLQLKRGVLPDCRGDYQQIRQLFCELLENAIKFFPSETEGIIEVSAEKSGNMVVYTVADNGRGIDPVYHPKIFSIYFQVDAHNTPGVGMGLYLVKKITEKHNGSLRFESDPGKGCRFFISLPAW